MDRQAACPTGNCPFNCEDCSASAIQEIRENRETAMELSVREVNMGLCWRG
jgi:hypothetical protein